MTTKQCILAAGALLASVAVLTHYQCYSGMLAGYLIITSVIAFYINSNGPPLIVAWIVAAFWPVFIWVPVFAFVTGL